MKKLLSILATGIIFPRKQVNQVTTVTTPLRGFKTLFSYSVWIIMIAMTIVIGVLTSTTFASIYFSDVPQNAWYKASLNDITQDSRKIIVGFPNGTFGSDLPFTVSQLATCVVKSSYYKDLKNEKATDIWYKQYITKSKELKYIDDGEFNEKDYDRAVTRAEMCRIVVRAVENIYRKQTYRDFGKIISLIADFNKIPDNLKDFVLKAYDLKVIGGFPDGTFRAEEPFTRGQAVVVINNLINPSKRKNDKVDTLFQSQSTAAYTGNSDKYYKINPDIPQELYQYEFRKDDKFGTKTFSNKELVERRGIDKVTEWMNIAKGYVETFYNVDYKTYDKAKYVEKLKWFYSSDGNWTADDGISRSVEEHIKYWANMVEEKQITIKTRFMTDPSLVYSGNSELIRGQMKFMVENC